MYFHHFIVHHFIVLSLVCTFCIVIILVLVWRLYAQVFVLKQEK